ncbi:sce7726 family protein [Acinetobacter tandoii]|nr:sce7726 family protein [Acinetobacter tandoii]
MSLEFKNLSKVFNSNVLNDVASGDFSYIQKMATNFFNRTLTYREFFDEAFQLLGKNYQNEYVFKNLIANKILCGRHSLNTATMLSEFRVGKNKADCVILNGKSTCYEIKTDYDSLVRLDDQLSSYLQLFDEVYVVCSKKFENIIFKEIPSEVGVISLTSSNTLRTLRKAKNRSVQLNKDLLIGSMRQSEYKQLAEEILGEKISLPNMLIYEKCLSIIHQYDNHEELNKKYIKILKKMRKNDDIFINSVPLSLTNAVISYKFSKKQQIALLDLLTNGEINVLPDITRKAV